MSPAGYDASHMAHTHDAQGEWMVEWSATVEKPDTREQPWTATVEESETTLEPFGWWDRIVHHLPFLRGRGWTLVCAAAALAAVWALLRATTRVR